MSGLVKLKLPAGGSKTLSAPDSASDEVVTLPAGTKTLADTGTTDALDTRVNAVGGRKNLIINGAMQVAQRGTSFTGQTGSLYSVDRWQWNRGTGTYSLTQENDSPVGSGCYKSLKLACTTSGTANTMQYMRQRLEGMDTAQLEYGTSGAKATTLSFWVKSNIVGTYGFGMIQHSTTQRGSYHIYTIAAADTWQKVTVQIPGDTGGDTEWVNTMYMSLDFFASGANGGSSPDGSWGARDTAITADADISTSGNYWQITGVQLELGDTATDFEHRSYGEELALCQRYYQKLDCCIAGYAASAGLTAGVASPVGFRTTMRVTPTMVITVGANINYSTYNTRNISGEGFNINLQANATGRVYADFDATFDAEL